MQNELRCCMRRTFSFIISLFLLTALLSCSFDGASTSGGGTANPLTSSNIVYVHGNLGFNSSESEGGALPYEILSQAQNYSYSNHAELVSASHASYSNGSLVNSAYPGIDTTSTGDMYYFAEATYDGLSTPVTGSFESGSSVFTIALEVGHAWTITAGVKKKASAGADPADTDKIVMKDSYTPDPILSTTNAVMTHSFVAAPVEDDDDDGEISLPMTLDSSINSMEVVCPAFSATPLYYEFSTTSYTFSRSNVPAGAYEVTFKFYNGTKPDGSDPDEIDLRVPLYTTTQTVNVVANMITNKWKSGSASIATSEVINAAGVFNVSTDVLSNYRGTVFYVGQTTAAANAGVTASDTNLGGAYEPLATFNKAIEIIENYGSSTKDYKIFITGTQTGNQTILSTLSTSNAKSITIEGITGLDSQGVPQDVFNAGGTSGCGSALNIQTAVPVIIKNLKITGGRATNGSGINIASGTKLTLAGGTLVTENQSTGDGGGIYCASGSTLTLSGTTKVSRNVGSGSGGGIALSEAALIVKDSASIEENQVQGSGWGGGVCVNGTGSSVTINGNARFLSNSGVEGGAIGAVGCTGGITIRGGTFSGNTATQGGGIRLWGTPLTMTGGTFEDNSAEQGGALCIRNENDVTHAISGSVYIPGVIGSNDKYIVGANDIYLAEDRFVTIAGSLSRHSSSNPIVITRSPWLRNKVIVEAGTSVSDITSYKDFFNLTNDDWEKIISSDNKKILIDSPIYVAGAETHPYTGVAGKSSADGGDGTKSHPFATIIQAVSAIAEFNDSTADYTIFVDGVVSYQVISSAISGKANSITVKGANGLDSNGEPKDVIDAGRVTSAFNISGGIPVTLESLKITNGEAAEGGGIDIAGNTTVILGNDLLVTGNKASSRAGGIKIQEGSSLKVKGNAKVYGNNTLDGKPSNVYLPTNKVIQVIGELKKGSDNARILVDMQQEPGLASTSWVNITSGYGYTTGGYNAGVAPSAYFEGYHNGTQYAVVHDTVGSSGEAFLALNGSGGITIAPMYDDITISADKTTVLKTATEKKFIFSATGVLNGSSTAIETGTDAGKISYSYAVSYHGETMTSPTHYTTGANYVTLDNSLPAGEYTITVTGVYHKTATEQTTYSASFEVKIVDGTVISSANIATMTFESGQKHYIKVDSSVTNENIGDLVSRLQDNEDIGESTLDLSGMNIETLTVDISLGRANITEIILPDSMTGVDASISASYFQSNSKLVSVVYSGNVSMNWGNWQFGYCTSLKNFPWQTLETGRMGNCMFWGCSSLETATIPAHVSLIGGYAFQDCSSLVEVHLLGTTPPQMETECFSGCDPNLVFYVPAGTSAAYEEAGYSSFGTIQEE